MSKVLKTIVNVILFCAIVVAAGLFGSTVCRDYYGDGG